VTTRNPNLYLRNAHLLFLTLSSCAALFAIALAVLLLTGLPVPGIEGMGNGGAFLATLVMLFLLLSVVAATVVGFLVAVLAYVYPDKLPGSRIYRVWWCAGVAAPGCITLLVFGGRELLSIL
jgi:hypothetical protein